MSPDPASLEACVAALRASPAFRSKRDIGRVAARIDAAPSAVARWRETGRLILLGDDTAAIPDGEGHLLFAAEGMLPWFIERDPYFAGWCSVMVNVSDVAAMGGYPLAVVDVYFHADGSAVERVMAGVTDACRAYGVPLVGGHTTRTDQGPHALAVAVLGRADALLTSFGARAGDDVLLAVDMRGAYHGDLPFWDASAGRRADELRGDLALLAKLAGSGHVHACKDVSNAGVAGTLLMMLEASRAGGVLDLDALLRPEGASLPRWLLSFPSYGFLLATPRGATDAVRRVFRERGIACERVGRVDATSVLRLAQAGREAELWDLEAQPFTGFAPRSAR